MMFPEKTGTELLLISEQGPTCFLTLFWLSEVKEPHSSGQHSTIVPYFLRHNPLVKFWEFEQAGYCSFYPMQGHDALE